MSDRKQAIELSVVVPSFNERDNIQPLFGLLAETLRNVNWEVIFVDDDSPDGTSDMVRALARQDSRVRCIQRVGRRGLSSACIEGMLSSSAPFVAVMDCDLQHDETLLPRMLEVLKRNEAEIVIGSRYMQGGGIGEWNASRVNISRFATRLSKFVIKADLTDPMSGFFMMRRELLHDAVRAMSGIGFKILVDIFASLPKAPRYKELPYQFRTRQAGESKLDSQVAWDYLMLLLDKTVGRFVPVRFIAFSLVGGVGVVVHLLTVGILFRMFSIDFVTSQTIATLTAMVGNFALNNILTYRDQRLRGVRWLRGLFSFMAACSVGAIANVGVAGYMFGRASEWMLAAFSGIVVGSVWNYAVTAVYTWNRPGKPGQVEKRP